MDACLWHVHLPPKTLDGLLDPRYCYDGNGVGDVTCGLARQSLVTALRAVGESLLLNTTWYETLEAFASNPSMVGFSVEQILLSRVASTGIGAAGIPGSLKVTIFHEEYSTIDTKHAGLYIPFKWNYTAIDAFSIPSLANYALLRFKFL